MGIFFMAITLFFVSNRAEILYDNSTDYYLSIGGEKSCFWCFFERNIFGGKMGVAASLAPRSLGPQDPTKKLAQWVDLRVNRYLENTLPNRLYNPMETVCVLSFCDQQFLVCCLYYSVFKKAFLYLMLMLCRQFELTRNQFQNYFTQF